MLEKVRIMKRKLGIVGFRGMVGSTLMDRMKHERDFDFFDITLFSKSKAGSGVSYFEKDFIAVDSDNIEAYLSLDIVITCQGSAFTEEVLPKLRSLKWDGYWIDAASSLRYEKDSVICLDPINMESIENGIKSGVKNYIGGNCTVSLLLLALKGLYENDLIEWVSSMTYQAVSGAGAKAIEELYSQYGDCDKIEGLNTLDKEKGISEMISEKDFPLAYNILPWIDSDLGGVSREEWKAREEASKIRGQETHIDGTCVRVSSLRCHSQALTIKLKKNIEVDEIEKLIKNSSEWIKFIPNDKENTLKYLTPHNFSNTLDIGVGRVRKMNFDPTILNFYTIGDQLLWGAAEPLRRTLRKINSTLDDL